LCKLFMGVVLILACAGSVRCESQLPVIRQTSPNDTRVPWVVSERPRQETLSWKLSESVPLGSWLRIRGANLRCIIGFAVSSVSWRNDQGAGEIPVEKRYTREEHFRDWGFFIRNPYAAAGKASKELPAGTQIAVGGRLGRAKTSGGSIVFRVESAADWNGPWKPISAWSAADLVAAEPKSIVVYLRANRIAHVVYLDEFGNPASPGKRTITLLDEQGKLLGNGVSTGGNSVAEFGPEVIPENTERVVAKDDRGLQACSNARFVASDDSNTYFGELHFHSEYSGDGFRPIRDSLSSAFNELGLDFATLGDHMQFSSEYRVQDYFDILDEFNQPPDHVTLLGYELGIVNGHFNPIYRTREASAGFDQAWQDYCADPRNIERCRISLEPFFKHFKPEDVIAIPHHTNHTSGPVIGKDGQPSWRNFDLRALDTRFTPVIEMCQARGSFETEATDPDWHVKVGGYGASLRTALARGLRIGFVGGSDNHYGWATRLADTPDYCSATGVQARGLTREAIFDAIKARRTYATTGVHIILDFTLNDKFPMGAEAKLVPTEKRTFKISVRGTAPIERAEIISQGATLAKLDTEGKRDLDIIWNDPRPDAPADDCYYYVRVRQTDGHCAWSSPIWVDCAGKSQE
jgi:hypothetical protein